ncbi:MAG: Rieske (2Fe-2S) protein [Thermoplasmata archaeon]|nr:Rieske (2Fe-2S) protein [Thermoplasmata archaeon]
MPWRSTGLALETLPPGSKREVLIEGATVLVVRVGPSVFALDGICTHEGGLLVDGTLEDEKIVCPLHGATYDTTSGAVLADPDGVVPPTGVATALQRYATRVDDGMVWVELP